MPPILISSNQARFVKGRSIVENVLLGQEVVRDFTRRTNFGNVAIKFDFMKSYDRVSWLFITKVLRSFRFSKIIIDMVLILVSDN